MQSALASQRKVTRVTLTERAVRLNRRSGRTDLPVVILMSDPTRLPDPRAAAQRLAAGSAVLLRHDDAESRRALVRMMAPVCRARGLLLIVSDDIALAETFGADGLHLPERRAAIADALVIRRRWRGLLTCAAHSGRALRRAKLIGADAALLSPIFATASHPGQDPLNVMRSLTLIRSAALPVYALGGIDAANAGRLASSNLVGLAGISGLV
jgi:thiamine-phosphate pyrophosphorylase